MFLAFPTNNSYPFIAFLVWSLCNTQDGPSWLVETIPCPAFHCGSVKEVSTSVKGLKVHTAALSAVFLLVWKCLRRGPWRWLEERQGKCMKKSSVEAVLWRMRNTVLLESHISAHCNNFPWHIEITFLSFFSCIVSASSSSSCLLNFNTNIFVDKTFSGSLSG